MNPTLSKLLLGIALLTLSLQTKAALVLTLEPASQMVNAGDLVALDLVANNLGAPGTATTLGGFDLKLNFDPALLSAASVSFGHRMKSEPLSNFKPKVR